ncbi:N-acetyl-gamma-glutamyl-phosphate reductase [Reyranella sp.]|jgi:N-acetyl-gamma-glutamyl-phosphate reductase|uniref:N-acetyl-gamma-glutamyl-phosphate reductase n=1 Tax=Reyranella sp. TaxID=1929291 RepID=UPI000BCC4664|nr:N-acetyl-gamma-glutamyl-phosphate reductase [Reyranella sp.]OYY46858.1 MAG: N-acetyl-gamma-glutamyl-phosphate reductase [Rhodospirillales bacterium 35-66-84]OYZ96878.1 MAG: N-acetyl-gamma-glutamyl-phosphate reductase [Rhodospirillales bacterium 24-66-33]OZB27793.1 MAG: N-acetyl-gamma-glutamyl-phosphate reductase [Rhodospirillales bacterium 39-66-50]HQS13774.1 N-acetyl-gamma-glutamyl-phosphate reductase [Reyranella sp.]HQT10259.1 N-acetyl-gamma-glutamyl-phosphate reductase [Reyranella sp.]
MNIRVGIVGISGFGGGEALRLVAGHPSFELVYAAGEGSAGSRLVDRFPGLPARLAGLTIEKWDPENLPELDVLFASLPTGASAAALARVPKDVKIVDIGGDHRYVDGWAYGLADVWPAELEGKSRVANPGCFPAATLTALAPLLANGLIEPGNILIDAKTGISGAGRGGADSRFGYAESNENLVPYGLLKHTHMPEMATTIERLSGGSAAGLVFTPHLVPMTRGVLATIYCRGRATTEQCLGAARRFYAGRSFIRVTDTPPQTKWATGSNLAFVSYAADSERNLVIALGVVDNLGKGAAGQAVQNANLICGLPETAGLDGMPVWP